VEGEPTNWADQAARIAHFFGNGKEHTANDGGWMTLCPVHGDTGKPNLHVTPKEDRVLLYCHACGDVRREEIVDKVREHFKLGGFSRGPRVLKKDERERWVTPIPASAPPRPTHCYLGEKLGKRPIDALWAYLDENKQFILFNARFNYVEGDGSAGKVYRRLALYTEKGTDQLAWSWFGPEKALPLYGLEQLSGDWARRPVLLVEGEKAADAARNVFPDMIVLSFPLGAGNFARINWDPLLKNTGITQVTLWPDNDAAGEAMAYGPKSLSAFLYAKRVRTRVVPVFDVPDLPRKWDLADPLPAGWDTNSLHTLLGRAEFSDVADVARVNKYCGTIAARTLSIDEHEKLSRTPCSTLEQISDSRCMQCLHYRRLNAPQDVVSMPDYQLDWVYLTRHKAFFNVRTKEELDSTALNAKFASEPGFTLTGKDCASSTLLTDEKTTKVYDFGYMPGSPVMMKGHHGELRMNRWSGFRVRPDFAEPPQPWLELAEYLITDEGVREHVYDWLAYTVQHPETKINHGLLMISPIQGVGKDSLIQPIREMFGSNYRDISSKSLDSEFTEYLLETKLLVISELDTIGHRRSTYDTMKPLLAAPPTMLNINVKNMKQIEIDNVIQVIAFSNKEVPVAIEDSDRRWLVYKIPHSREQIWSPDKFKAYYKWLHTVGTQRVFGWLLRRDVSAFNPGLPAPATSAKTILARLSDARVNVLRDMIEAYAYPFDRDLVGLDTVYNHFSKNSNRIGKAEITRYCDLDDAAVLPSRMRVDGKLIRVFACRHGTFWKQQAPQFLRKAFGAGYIDMTSRANPGGTDAPGNTGDMVF